MITVELLLKFTDQNKTVRVIDSDPVNVVIYPILEEKRAIAEPERMSRSAILEGLNSGTIEIVSDDKYRPTPIEQREENEETAEFLRIEKKKDERRDARYEVVTWVLTELGMDVTNKKRWRETTCFAARKFGRTVQLVRRWISIYWRQGLTKAALRPDYRTERKRLTKNPGKRGEKGSPHTAGCSASPEMQELIRDFVKANLKKRMSRKELYDALLDEHFAAGINGYRDDGSPIISHKPVSECPSFPSFIYYLYRDRDEVNDAKTEVGDSKYLKDLREIVGSSIARTKGPGLRVELDFTIGSVLLVSEVRREQIIGKPVIGLAYDVYSSAVVGLLVTFEHASELQTRFLLESVMSNKVEFCARYGEKIKEEDWPMWFVPKEVIFDRGSESKFEIGDDFAQEFEIGWTNLRTGAPQDKGSVESAFSKMERAQKSMKGWEPQFWKRGDPIPEKKATYTLREFTVVLIKEILAHNKKLLMEDRYIDPAAIAAGINPTPNELYKFGVETVGKLKREVDPKALRIRCLESESAQLTGKGILFKNLHYDATSLRSDFVKSRRLNNQWIKVRYNPHTVAEIYFRPNPNKKEFVACTLVEKYAHFAPLTFVEYAKHREENRQIELEQYLKSREEVLSLHRQKKDIEAEATRKTLQARLEAGLGTTGYLDKDKTVARKQEAARGAKEDAQRHLTTPAPNNIIPMTLEDQVGGLPDKQPEVAPFKENFNVLENFEED